MKGMQKIKRGRGFRGVVTYAFKNPAARFLCGSECMPAMDRDGIISEFAAAHVLRPDIGKPVWHNSLRLPPGERVSDDELEAVSRDYMSRMGFTENHQWVAVIHDDPDGLHVHLIANRVGLDGNVYLGKNENLVSTRHIQRLEIDHGLTITKGPKYREGAIADNGIRYTIDRQVSAPGAANRRASKGELGAHRDRQARLRTRDELPRTRLQRLLAEASATGTVRGFVEHLQFNGVHVAASVATTGRVSGLAFEVSGERFKASSLGRRWGWAELSRTLGFDAGGDGAYLAQLREFARPEIGGGRDSDIVGRDIGAGSVTYEAIKGRARGVEAVYIHRPLDQVAFIERTRSIEFRLTDAETIGAGLRLAAGKWPTLTLSGTDAFKRAAVREAVAMGLGYRIANPELRDRVARERDALTQRRAAEAAAADQRRREAAKSLRPDSPAGTPPVQPERVQAAVADSRDRLTRDDMTTTAIQPRQVDDFDRRRREREDNDAEIGSITGDTPSPAPAHDRELPHSQPGLRYRAEPGRAPGVQAAWFLEPPRPGRLALVERAGAISVRLDDEETVRAAMLRAHEKWDSIEITGSAVFKERAVRAAVQLGCADKIKDPALQAMIAREKAAHEQRQARAMASPTPAIAAAPSHAPTSQTPRPTDDEIAEAVAHLGADVKRRTGRAQALTAAERYQSRLWHEVKGQHRVTVLDIESADRSFAIVDLASGQRTESELREMLTHSPAAGGDLGYADRIIAEARQQRADALGAAHDDDAQQRRRATLR